MSVRTSQHRGAITYTPAYLYSLSILHSLDLFDPIDLFDPLNEAFTIEAIDILYSPALQR